MAYNPNIPQPGDLLSVSQGDLLENFTQLNDIFEVDHLTYDAVDAPNRGKHMAIHMREQLSDPTTAAQELAFYCKRDSSSNLALYLRKESNGAIVPFSLPLTGTTTGSIVVGGVRLQWGSSTIPGSQDRVAVVFPVAFSSNAWQVMVTPYGNPVRSSDPRELGCDSTTFSTTGFTCVSWNGTVPGGGCPFGYFAIGPV
jgi:hypothetical protein